MIERYTRAEMGRIWTLENRYHAWLTVELAVCEAWCEMGRIPMTAMETIRRKAGVDVTRILEIEEITRHDVIAFLTSLEEKTGPEARFIHLGCTSSDIVDTANALLLQQASELILEDMRVLLDELEELACRHKGVLCMGRTHGIHAEPTSFGLKIAGFYAEFTRHFEHFAIAVENIRVGKISGAVGTYAFLSPELEAKALARLHLKADERSTQIVQRDRYARFFSALAVTAGGIERLCTELRHLQRTEVLEAEEGFSGGQKGSSAMPHKKNPISAENMCGLARLIRSNALAAMENQPLWHERDISHSSVERVIMPDSTILMDYALARLASLLRNLVVKPERMRENMEKSFGLCFSQRLLTALVDQGLPRQKAYETVQRLAMQSWESRQSFSRLAQADADIRACLPETALAGLFDASYYLNYEDVVFARLFGSRGTSRQQHGAQDI